MNKTIIENTLKFMERVDLKWNEVPAFVECINYITSLANNTEKNNIKQEDNTSNNI